ncbi:MAG: hypothetical protein ACYDAQ_14255 [Mycobacteriales bacterium]
MSTLALAPTGAAFPSLSTDPRVLAVLPPGESGSLSTATGQSAGQASGNSASYGPHVDDQRALYWGFGYRTGGFEAPTGTPQTPAPGVQIYRDVYGGA